MENSNGSPIIYPKVTFLEDGQEQAYEVRFSMLAQFVLDEAGVDTRQLKDVLGGMGAGKVALYMKLFAAGVAHHFVALKQPYPPAAEWAARIGDDAGKFREIMVAVNAAMGKAPSPATAATPAPGETAAQPGGAVQ